MRLKSLALLAFCLVAFGQPAFSPVLGVLASVIGYALFWFSIIDITTKKKRFWFGTVWFGLVQMVQLSWLPSHPFAYIWGLYFFLCFFIGVQFGLLCALITKERLNKWMPILGLAGLYTILEWSRLFIFSGFSLNPIGLSLTSTLFGLQNASIAGVFGLTFTVLLTNLVALRLMKGLKQKTTAFVFGCLCFFPYIFGYLHIFLHKEGVAKADHLNAFLVQTAFPVEEAMSFSTFQDAVNYVEEEWVQILKVLSPVVDKQIDLIVLPEYVVPYGTYMAIFSYDNVKKVFEELFGARGKEALPPLKEPLALELEGDFGSSWQVTNAYYLQALANLFQADVVAGLQDDQWISIDDKQSYSAALYFWPGGELGFRYEKRVLLPLAEYIPFEFCRQYAREYGITGSFCPGVNAKVFPGCKVPFGLSICYEETYGALMLESRLKGSELLINLTSDVWYPNSRLPKQHFDHARLRTVEAGIPLVRSCNTGITSAFNSLGEVVGSLKEEDEWVRQGLYVQVPLYSYKTLYSFLGDSAAIIGSLLLSLFLIKKSS